MFPQVPKQIIEILNRTMTFDPRSRATVDEVLEHEFFTECRRKELEFAREPIEMEF
jgi:serine/threonine protein kinase